MSDDSLIARAVEAHEKGDAKAADALFKMAAQETAAELAEREAAERDADQDAADAAAASLGEQGEGEDYTPESFETRATWGERSVAAHGLEETTEGQVLLQELGGSESPKLAQVVEYWKMVEAEEDADYVREHIERAQANPAHLPKSCNGPSRRWAAAAGNQEERP